MRQRTGELPPLGLSGQLHGLPTLQSDRGDVVQELFAYQWTAGVVLLSAALAGKIDYEAIWCEHHEDYLAVVTGGRFDAIQVKTLSGEGALWHCPDAGFVQSIRRFAEHESKFEAQIRSYRFFSNALPYVPAMTVTLEASKASSPMRIREACRLAPNAAAVAAPYKGALAALAKATGHPVDLVFKVLSKLEFQQGPSLAGFREQLLHSVAEVPGCASLSFHRLRIVRDELLTLVEKTNNLDLPTLDCFAAVLAADGRPEALIRSKQISVEAARLTINQAQEDVFLYADAGGNLQLGNAMRDKDVLRQKMSAGYVGNFFDSIWLQAQGAERRLLEQAYVEPEATERKVDQLVAVVLVECQNAEAEHALEQDEQRKGLRIYQQILNRTSELATNERASVAGEPVQTLRGIAGLLSGACKFAWGVPVPTGGPDGT